jgi:hypothetical protein
LKLHDHIMKIEIELVDSVHARITIDGKKMDYIMIGKQAGLHPLTDIEREATIGGMVASRLCDVLGDILQAHIPEEGNAQGDSWGTWEKLSERVADTTYRRMM